MKTYDDHIDRILQKVRAEKARRGIGGSLDLPPEPTDRRRKQWFTAAAATALTLVMAVLVAGIALPARRKPPVGSDTPGVVGREGSSTSSRQTDSLPSSDTTASVDLLPSTDSPAPSSETESSRPAESEPSESETLSQTASMLSSHASDVTASVAPPPSNAPSTPSFVTSAPTVSHEPSSASSEERYYFFMERYRLCLGVEFKSDAITTQEEMTNPDFYPELDPNMIEEIEWVDESDLPRWFFPQYYSDPVAYEQAHQAHGIHPYQIRIFLKHHGEEFEHSTIYEDHHIKTYRKWTEEDRVRLREYVELLRQREDVFFVREYEFQDCWD